MFREFSARLPEKIEVLCEHKSNPFLNNHLEISNQVRTDEAVVEALELIADVVISSFADNVFETSHHVVDEPLVYSLEKQMFDLIIIAAVSPPRLPHSLLAFASRRV